MLNNQLAARFNDFPSYTTKGKASKRSECAHFPSPLPYSSLRFFVVGVFSFDVRICALNSYKIDVMKCSEQQTMCEIENCNVYFHLESALNNERSS